MSIIIVDDGQISYSNPFGVERTRELESLLTMSGCFVPSFAGADPYSVDTYIRQYAIHRTKTVFLFDRNIYSDVLSLGRGEDVSQNTRISAAIMAFASCAHASVAPGIAICEGAASGARAGWGSDLALFHASDNIHAANWAMLALGYAGRFDRKIPRKKPRLKQEKPFNPRMKLSTFEFNYPALLKLAILVRRGGDRNSRMIEFIEWMYWSWQFSAPALLLATVVLGTKPPKRTFKGLHSNDRTAALRGVWNAAWDLVYVHEWMKKIQTQGVDSMLYVLCSRDATLLGVAELLRRSLFEPHKDDQVWLDGGFSKRVQETYVMRSLGKNNTGRALHPIPRDFSKYRRKLLKGLRQEFESPSAIRSL